MAIAFVQDATGSTSDTVTVPAGGFAAGNLIVFAGMWDDASTVSAVNDTGGNSYAQAQRISAGGISTEIWYASLTTPLASGNTIVATLAGNDGFWCAAEFSGITSSSPLDQAPAGTTDTGTSHTSATTGTTAVADELLIGTHCATSTHTFVATGGFTQNDNTTIFGFTFSMQYRIVSAVGTYASTCTSGSATANNLIVTFKGATAPGADTGLAWIRA